MSDFPAITHVVVTVTDLGRNRAWYKGLFGAELVLDEDTGPFHHVVWLLGGTLFEIHRHAGVQSGEPFDERHSGLDHVAFACANRAELESWQDHLNSLGIHNGGIVDAHHGSGLSFRDPDNIALEFLLPRLDTTALADRPTAAHVERNCQRSRRITGTLQVPRDSPLQGDDQ